MHRIFFKLEVGSKQFYFHDHLKYMYIEVNRDDNASNILQTSSGFNTNNFISMTT